HLHTAGAHRGDEVGVVALGAGHPHHLVEEQVSSGGRGQPPVRQTRRADDHAAQPAHLGVHTQHGQSTVTLSTSGVHAGSMTSRAVSSVHWQYTCSSSVWENS